MVRLARAQTTHIAREETDQLLATSAERERLAEKIDILDEQNDRLGIWLKEHMIREYSALAGSEEQLLALLKEIQAVDQDNNRQLQQMISGYQSQLRGLRQTRHVIDSYTSAYTSQEGTYFDIKK